MSHQFYPVPLQTSPSDHSHSLAFMNVLTSVSSSSATSPSPGPLPLLLLSHSSLPPPIAHIPVNWGDSMIGALESASGPTTVVASVAAPRGASRRRGPGRRCPRNPRHYPLRRSQEQGARSRGSKRRRGHRISILEQVAARARCLKLQDRLPQVVDWDEMRGIEPAAFLLV
eukprot:757896-Hanusia_phi.AAC.1